MLRTLSLTRDYSQLYRLLLVAFFAGLTTIAAQVEVRLGTNPVPFTLQVLAVILSGLVLGARDGAFSQLLYVVLIRLNMPFGAGAAGADALFGATAGYLVGFVPAAWVVGFLTERGETQMWRRVLAGVAGIAVIYLFGVPVLKTFLGVDWGQAWAWGGAPFIGVDLGKAIIAASMAEGLRAQLLLRTNTPTT
jgi:biotin transport system substrate-specific component